MPHPGPQGGGKLTPLLTYGGSFCTAEHGGHAMFSTRSFNNKDRLQGAPTLGGWPHQIVRGQRPVVRG